MSALPQKQPVAKYPAESNMFAGFLPGLIGYSKGTVAVTDYILATFKGK